MKIESIVHEAINDTDRVITTVVIDQVSSQCILARLIIKALGKPGIDNDLEMLGSGDRWMIVWTQPKSQIHQTRELITQAIT
ncbi:hypothetical protein [Crocosphaera sp. XPORK-15E]|uniref:hypothetical protein n=1 Tax=Crocosphaera sp. XPORK-15E TaxID=3110247 RepID=UPI002B213FD8|nr:hypothetical protein [Crocosphaera sp. XPORK-15E]MEA5535185.1 hypothetical protein [Crocosphaera sp. XPORK-15E]